MLVLRISCCGLQLKSVLLTGFVDMQVWSGRNNQRCACVVGRVVGKVGTVGGVIGRVEGVMGRVESIRRRVEGIRRRVEGIWRRVESIMGWA